MIKSEKIHTLMSQCNPCVMCRINPHYCHTHGACNILRAWVSLCDEIEHLEKVQDNAPLAIDELKDGMWIWVECGEDRGYGTVEYCGDRIFIHAIGDRCQTFTITIKGSEYNGITIYRHQAVIKNE